MKKYKYLFTAFLTALVVQTSLFNMPVNVGAEMVREVKASETPAPNKAIDRNERYFRPSSIKPINNKDFDFTFFDQFEGKKAAEINLPKNLFLKPNETVINYFSILREANNMSGGRLAGCGTIGYESIPYPIAYNFFTKDYRNKVDYSNYYNSFKNISHINLLTLQFMGFENTSPQTFKYFIELETIEPSEKRNTYFGYYYGYIYLKNENGYYKISDIKLTGEDFLCAAYHGWQHNAESYVDIVYGNWCKLISKRYATSYDGYTKNIRISGTDGKEYLFKFAQLTNGIDIEIGQFVKVSSNQWESVKIDVDKCLEKMKLNRD